METTIENLDKIQKLDELNEKQLAVRWGMKASTLRWWRSVGKGPPYNKRVGKVTYSMTDILYYEAGNKIYPKKK